MSVTQAMCESGLVDTTWYDQWGRERGSAIHKAIQLYEEDDLDLESVDPNVMGYFDAYLKFKDEKKWRPMETELHVFDPVRGFAGTLDAIGYLKNRVTLVDYKTGPLTRQVGIQLSGYAIGLKVAHSNTIVQGLVGVQLKHDGTYKIKSYPFEPAVFLAALEISRWMRNN